jgi:drug/metabolite transporter (DMT)-like permease
MTAIDATMGRRDWALLGALSVLWGGSFLFVGVAVREIPPLLLVAARVLIAALALHAVLRVTRTPFPATRAAWGAFLGMGLLNNAIPFTLIAWGQAHIASGLASILNATTPLFTVIVAHWLTADERMRGRRLAGVAIGFVGVAAMVGGSALERLGVDVAAQLAVLAAAISYAFAGVFGRRFKALGIPPLATAAGQVTASSLMLAPVALIVAPPWSLPVPSAGALLAVLALALLSTALA